MRANQIPNAISILRILLALPLVLVLLDERYALALWLFAIAGASDALDGYLAKHFNWRSRLGAILDPLADKLLLMFAYLSLGWLGDIPLWLVVTVVLRDVIIVLGGLAYHYMIGRFDLTPTLLSKLNTVAQIVLIIAVLFTHSIVTLPQWLITGMIYAVLATTLLSGLSYMVIWGMRALRTTRKA